MNQEIQPPKYKSATAQRAEERRLELMQLNDTLNKEINNEIEACKKTFADVHRIICPKHSKCNE